MNDEGLSGMDEATFSHASLAERAQRVLRRLCDSGLKLATAESCTGGLVAALVTDIEGCSHAFDRGFVVYTNAAKTDLLGVDPEVLRRNGAVSVQVATAMAEGALRRSDAEIAVSVTGYAGPAGPGAEEGRVCFALARRGAETIRRDRSFGPIGRDAIRRCCLDVVLDLLDNEA